MWLFALRRQARRRELESARDVIVSSKVLNREQENRLTRGS